jgi:hypothetical protein
MYPQMIQAEIQSAVDKLVLERSRALTEARAIIRRSDRDELIFLLIHMYHVLRVGRIAHADAMSDTDQAMSNLIEDTHEYAIQLVYKYGRPSSKAVMIDDYYRLLEICRFVNSNYELETMLRHLPFERSGERLQHFKIFLDAMASSDERKSLYEYGARHELDSSLRHSSWKHLNALFDGFFPESMNPEFLEVFGLTTTQVRTFYDHLLSEVTRNLTRAEQRMPRLPNGGVDVLSFKSVRAARRVYTLRYDDFLNRFGQESGQFRRFLLEQMLRRDQVDEFELRHFAIWRHPICRLSREEFTFSPEILTFSPSIGLHYALLEDARTKDSYQAKRAAQFQKRVEDTLVSHRLRIIGKNLEAAIGKRDIGDVDLLAENDQFYFNVECKGATLPLLVYFHDFDYIRNVHLPYLRDEKEWDKKVKAREQWLEDHRAELRLTPNKPILSLIVSDSPEVLSHFSQVLCLSLHEFPLWYALVAKERRFVDFTEFFKDTLWKKMIVATDAAEDGLYREIGLSFEREEGNTE